MHVNEGESRHNSSSNFTSVIFPWSSGYQIWVVPLNLAGPGVLMDSVEQEFWEWWSRNFPPLAPWVYHPLLTLRRSPSFSHTFPCLYLNSAALSLNRQVSRLSKVGPRKMSCSGSVAKPLVYVEFFDTSLQIDLRAAYPAWRYCHHSLFLYTCRFWLFWCCSS